MVKLELHSITGRLDLVSPGRRQSAGRQGERRNVPPVDARGSASGASPASRGTSPVSPRAASLLSCCSAQGPDSVYHWLTTSAWPERDMEAKGSSCLEIEAGKGGYKVATPSESPVSARNNRHQAHRTSASMEMTSGINRAGETDKGVDLGMHPMALHSYSIHIEPQQTLCTNEKATLLHHLLMSTNYILAMMKESLSPFQGSRHFQCCNVGWSQNATASGAAVPGPRRKKETLTHGNEQNGKGRSSGHPRKTQIIHSPHQKSVLEPTYSFGITLAQHIAVCIWVTVAPTRPQLAAWKTKGTKRNTA